MWLFCSGYETLCKIAQVINILLPWSDYFIRQLSHSPVLHHTSAAGLEASHSALHNPTVHVWEANLSECHQIHAHMLLRRSSQVYSHTEERLIGVEWFRICVQKLKYELNFWKCDCTAVMLHLVKLFWSCSLHLYHSDEGWKKILSISTWETVAHKVTNSFCWRVYSPFESWNKSVQHKFTEFAIGWVRKLM